MRSIIFRDWLMLFVVGFLLPSTIAIACAIPLMDDPQFGTLLLAWTVMESGVGLVLLSLVASANRR